MLGPPARVIRPHEPPTSPSRTRPWHVWACGCPAGLTRGPMAGTVPGGASGWLSSLMPGAVLLLTPLPVSPLTLPGVLVPGRWLSPTSVQPAARGCNSCPRLFPRSAPQHTGRCHTSGSSSVRARSGWTPVALFQATAPVRDGAQPAPAATSAGVRERPGPSRKLCFLQGDKQESSSEEATAPSSPASFLSVLRGRALVAVPGRRWPRRPVLTELQ